MGLDKEYYTKADILALAGLSYGRQDMFAKKAGVKSEQVDFEGRMKTVYSKKSLLKILDIAGYREHKLDGEGCLLKLQNVIKL